MRMPSPLQPGDLVRVVAPAGPFDPALAWRGLGWLASRYRVQFDRSMFQAHGYLAGPDSRRRDELRHAMQDPGCNAIVAVRGGYGINRLAHELDWSSFATAPKWIVGFSDVTALHVECAAAGVMSMHATMAAHLGRSDDRTRDAWIDAIEDPQRRRVFPELEILTAGLAEGTLFGGNLTMLHACAAAGRLRVPRDAVLFLEDVGERPYRIDRALTTLRIGGHLDHVRAVVLGQFSECQPGPDGVTVEQALLQALAPIGVPIVRGMDAGHGEPNAPLLLGATARVDARLAVATLETFVTP